MTLIKAPIQRKLLAIILTTCGIVLLLTCSTFFIFEYVTLRDDAALRLSTLGRIVATNSTAALVFDDQQGAQDVLDALAAERHVSAAVLYDEAGQAFSSFPKRLSAPQLPEAEGLEEFRFTGAKLYGYMPVVQDGRRLGTLYLEFNMEPMYERMQFYGGLVTFVFLASLLVAFVLSRRLQLQISQPILSLVSTARAVTERSDYSVRAKSNGENEFGLLTDAFNRMLAEIQKQTANLRESEEHIRQMVASVQDYAIIMLDPEGHIVSWNSGAERINGYTEVEMLGEHFSRLHAESEMLGDAASEVLQVADDEGRCQLEGWRVRKDNTRFYSHIVITALHDDEGQLRGFCKVTRDITERKINEENIRSLNADLERRVEERTLELRASNQELEAFCYSVSHDLRAPLRSIHGFSQALMEDAGPSLKGEELNYLQRICAATTRMGDLIDSLLYLSRLTRDEILRETVDVSAISQAICEELQQSAPERKVEWRIAPGMVAWADHRLLHAAMMNLLGNSWKYSENREVALIECGVITKDEMPVFFVKDNGAGFDMAYSGKLFRVFQRLHGVHEFNGIGIGLATVQRIIHRHGGRVWGEGKVDGGATFYFTLGNYSEKELQYEQEGNLVSRG